MPADAKLLADLVRTDRHNHRRDRRGQRSGRGDQGAGPGASESDLGADPAHQQPAQRVAGVLPRRLGGLRRSGRPRRAGHPGPRPDPHRRSAFEPVQDPLSTQSCWAPTQPRHPGITDSGRCCAPNSSPRPTRSPPRSGPAPAPRSASSPNSTTRSADLEAELATHFEAHPDTDIYRSLPGLGVILGARVLGEFGDDPNRYTTAKCRKNYAGTSPLTIASGRKRAVLARHIRNRRLYDALDAWAFCAITRSPGARAYLRPAPSGWKPAPPSPTRPGQPSRQHPPRLSTPPHHIRRTQSLGTPTEHPNHPRRLTTYALGMSNRPRKPASRARVRAGRRTGRARVRHALLQVCLRPNRRLRRR